VRLVNAFTLFVLHGHDGPNHQGVASSLSLGHYSSENGRSWLDPLQETMLLRPNGAVWELSWALDPGKVICPGSEPLVQPRTLVKAIETASPVPGIFSTKVAGNYSPTSSRADLAGRTRLNPRIDHSTCVWWCMDSSLILHATL
jgi:hypothetical protein